MINKPKFIFILGVEGCGHHGLEAALNHFFSEANVQFQESPWHTHLTDLWAKIEIKQRFRKDPIIEYQETIQSHRLRLNDIAKDILMIASSKNIEFFVETCSFPYDSPRMLNKSPDLLSFNKVFSQYFDIHYIHITRDLSDCIVSDIRRGFTKNTYEQSNIIIWNDFYIKGFLKNTSLKTCEVSYENLIDDCSKTIKKISDFIKFDIEPALNLMRTPSKPSKEEIAIKEEILENFF